MTIDSSFENLTDEMLVELAVANNDEAMEFLIDKYRNLVKKRARTMYIMGAEKDDLIQEGMIGLYKAITSFNIDINVSFAAYADRCVTNKVLSAVEAYSRHKHSPLNSYISLNGDNEESRQLLNDLIHEAPGPEQQMIFNEKRTGIAKLINEFLSKTEKEVIVRYLDGMSYSKISEEIDKSEKSIDNALQRIKNKLKKALSEEVNR